MGIIRNIRNVAKIYGNLRGFSKKRNLLNIARNYNPLLAIQNVKKVEKIIPEKVRRQAEFAEAAYQAPENRKDIDGWDYIPKVSSDTIAVFKKGDKINIAHRGTKKLKDLATDTFILNNNIKNSERFKSAKENVNKIIEELGSDKKYKQIGHSLGANIAKEIARDLNQKSISYNPGQSTVFNKYEKNKNYVIKNDPVSNSLLFQDKNVKVFEGKTKPHSLKNFLMNNNNDE